MFWRAFLTDLKKRGLGGVKLVISDRTPAWSPRWSGPSKEGRTSAAGCTSRATCSRWCPRPTPTDMGMVAAVFRTIFAQPDATTVAATWDEVRDQLVPCRV